MQLYPLTSESVEPADCTDQVAAVHPRDVEQGVRAGEQTPRTFCVVFFRDLRGPLWKVDVVADDAINAARSVVYREGILAELVTGVIDLATIR
jgi:hypothetical protein